MFLNKYLDEFYYNLLLDTYEEEYLNDLDEENFIKIYNLFNEHNVYFINDIILNYIEIFFMDVQIVQDGFISLKEKLGDNYINIIGNDMKYLQEIIG